MKRELIHGFVDEVTREPVDEGIREVEDEGIHEVEDDARSRYTQSRR